MKLWQRKKTPAGGGGTEGRWTRYLEIQRSRIFSSAPGVSTFPTSAPGARAAEGKSKGPQPNLLRDFFSLLPPASVVAACFFTNRRRIGSRQAKPEPGRLLRAHLNRPFALVAPRAAPAPAAALAPAQTGSGGRFGGPAPRCTWLRPRAKSPAPPALLFHS